MSLTCFTVYLMNFTPLIEGFANWSQTSLGTAIVAPLVVAAVLALALATLKFIRSIPGRLFLWLERKAGQL